MARNSDAGGDDKLNFFLCIYNFTKGFGWAYKQGGGRGLISGVAYKWNKKYDSAQRDKMYLRNELKLTYHNYILSYIYNTFIVTINGCTLFQKHQ